MRHTTTTRSAALMLLLVAPPLLAQSPAAHSAHPTPAAIAQIRQVQRATLPLASTTTARTAGFEPVLGWIPFMGTHWVNGARMLNGSHVNLTEPSQLMFSTVDGKETLVGAAFAYFTPIGDTTRVSPFDGSPKWHDHPDLSPPGTNLVMLHVWFVPSPDGPFAGHNPFLPFWAAGLTPPALERMHDRATNLRVRKAALALAEIADTAGLFPVIARRAPVREVLDERRAAIRALVPELEAARRAGDIAKWDALADQLGTHFDAMRAAYLKSAVNPEVNARIVAAIEEMLTGAHGSHAARPH